MRAKNGIALFCVVLLLLGAAACKKPAQVPAENTQSPENTLYVTQTPQPTLAFTPTPTVATPSPSPVVPTPTPTLSRDESGVLQGSEKYDAPMRLMCKDNRVNVREQAGADAKVVASMSLGQIAETTEVVDGWYAVTVYPGMQKGYVRSDLLTEYDDTKKFRAQSRRDTITVLNAETGEEEKKKSNLVDVRTYLPDIEYYLIFATPNNFTGSVLYARDICLLQEGTVKKLVKAQELFAQDGYRIKIYDAYRPSKVSGILYSIIKNSTYIASAGKSIHNRGAAVDITLVDADGNELEMPTAMHTLNETANRDYKGMTETARKNMDYMAQIMRKSGFSTIRSEWWHFSDTNMAQYPALDIDFRDITVVEWTE